MTTTHIARSLLVVLVTALAPIACAGAKPVKTEVVPTAEGFELRRGGEPYRVYGVGGPGDLGLLAEIGGNTVRTWGAEQLEETFVGSDGQRRNLLDHAHRLGISVIAGFWIRHERHGFDYDDEQAVRDQLDRVADFVRRYKDHPALLMWGVGNEVEIEADLDTALRAVDEAAALIKSIDPYHPTLIVVSELGEELIKPRRVMDLCPNIDIFGVNAYGGLINLAERLSTIELDRPYIVCEHGHIGPWEAGTTDWGAPYEPTSTRKAELLHEAYTASILGAGGDCLGSCAFLWGDKQERTATWFGMLLSTGERTAMVDTLHELWTGRRHPDPAPAIADIVLSPEPNTVRPGATFTATVEATSPGGRPLRYEWIVLEEATDIRTGGDREDAPSERPRAVTPGAPGEATVTAPDDPGEYRLFVYVYDDNNAAATANMPFRVID